ncbi:MAG: FAD-binding oxidoreductase [Patescibacteria group bacterium]|nr:FAD-binding oxidoreductase [Patescibacteria group bacterium]
MITMIENLKDNLKKIIKGDVEDSALAISEYSHDASLFEVKPQVVVFPKDAEDIENLVKFVNEHKKDDPNLSLTGRSAGTDMSGGPLNSSIIVSFGRYFTKIGEVKNDSVQSQPGVFYRDLEKETLKKDLIFPSYPASREICAVGGIVNNNSGGEKSLRYGKTENYVEQVDVVLSDGKLHTLKPLNRKELEEKMSSGGFEGELYSKMYKLISENYDLLQQAKPKVHKNSAGYYLWNVWDKEKDVFDLIKVFVGAQGTLGLLSDATLKLVSTEKYSRLVIIFLKNLDPLAKVINDVLPMSPESFEAYDDNTLKLAIKFFPSFAKLMGAKNLISIGFQFLPEFLMLLKGGLPKLILQVEFVGNDEQEIDKKAEELKQKIVSELHLQAKVARSDKDIKKYWLIRRESFNLLRNKIKDKHTAPFIDDIIVDPQKLDKFLPELTGLFKEYPSLIYTIAGHVGDGNFHVIPLMKIEDPNTKKIIEELGPKVYDLVLKYGGSITAEHNDGIIRSPYLKEMYGDKVYALFEETKKIFDPHNIFNPGKKVNSSMEYAMSHIREHW